MANQKRSNKIYKGRKGLQAEGDSLRGNKHISMSELLSLQSKKVDLSSVLDQVRALIGESEFEKANRLISELLKEKLDPIILADVLLLKARIELSQGNFLKVIGTCEKAYEKIRNTGEHKKMADIFYYWGVGYLGSGKYEKAIQYLEDALSFYRRSDCKEDIVKTLYQLASIYFDRCDYKLARHYLDRALKSANQLERNKRDLKVSVFLAYATMNLVEGNWEKTEEYFQKILNALEDSKHSQFILTAKLGLGIVYLRKRQFKDAEKILEESLKLSSKWGYIREKGIAHEFLGELEFERGNYEKADYHYNEALEIALENAPEGDLMNQVERMRAELFIKTGELEKVEDSLKRALRVSRKLGDRLEFGIIHRVFGELNQKLGDRRKAQYHFRRSIEILELIDEKYERAKALLAYGDFLLEGSISKRGRGNKYFVQAEELFGKLGASYWRLAWKC